jgi:predicted nucleotide-binding protein
VSGGPRRVRKIRTRSGGAPLAGLRPRNGIVLPLRRPREAVKARVPILGPSSATRPVVAYRKTIRILLIPFAAYNESARRGGWAMEKLPQGQDLKRALAERGISTAGLPVSVLGTPMEAAMQGRLLEVMRLEREEKMAKSAGKPPVTPASLDPKQALRVLRTLHEKGRSLNPSDRNEIDAWVNTTREMLIRAFSSASDNIAKFDWVGAYRQPPNPQQDLREQLALLGSCIEQLEFITGDAAEARAAATPNGDRIFIGHGADPAWREVKDFVVDRLKLQYDEFNREPTAGMTTAERLQKMLDESAFALIIMTAEDEHGDGKQHARENVVHEAGLFQGRLGFRRAIILLEEGCEEFSNIEGVTQIRFTRGQVSAKFEEIRKTLEREGLLPKWA